MPNLQDGSQWHQVYDEMKRATVLSPTSYIPIPPFQIPHTFAHHTLFFATDSEEALARWWLGVRVQMLITVPSSDFGALSAERVNIPVNRGLLVRFSKLSDTYEVRVEVPEWHQTMRLTVWEYRGMDGDASLEVIREDLQRIEGKVNSLL